MQQYIIEIALQNQIQTDLSHIHRKQLSTSQPYDFQSGQYVIYSGPNTFQQTDTRSDKLTPHYKGPYQIVDITSQNITVRNLLNQQIRTVHPAHIHPFVVDPNKIDPTEIAQKASQEYVIEKILKINGYQNNKGRYHKTGLEAQVRWKGYDESEDSWEPYKQLRYNTMFIKYCQQNGLQYLIPTNIDSNDLNNLS